MILDKGIRNAYAVARKIGPAFIRVTNHRLEITSEERRKRVEMVERRITEAIDAKCRKARGGINSLVKRRRIMRVIPGMK